MAGRPLRHPARVRQRGGVAGRYRKDVDAALRWVANIYIELFHGTSLRMQLFWLFFVLPLPPFNVSLTPYTVAVLGLELSIGVYGAEVMRGALLAVPRGQWEAPSTLNMSPWNVGHNNKEF